MYMYIIHAQLRDFNLTNGKMLSLLSLLVVFESDQFSAFKTTCRHSLSLIITFLDHGFPH